MLSRPEDNQSLGLLPNGRTRAPPGTRPIRAEDPPLPAPIPTSLSALGARLRAPWLVLALVTVIGAGAPGRAAASWMIPPSPYRAKDFTLVKRGSHYHVFYTRTNETDPYGESEKSIGHAESQDLYHWTQLDTVLTVRPDSWDNLHVWAPSILEMDGVYYMYYTGVSDRPDTIQFHQRIGLATSTDLVTWNRLDYPVFSCEQVPWSFCDSTRSVAGNFRDPFVMPDPSDPGHLLLYYSTVAQMDTNRYVVGLASSAGDPAQWTDVKPMEVTDRPTTGWDLAESPHLFAHAGEWYLFFTTNGPEPLVWATTTADPTSDPEAWTYHGSLGPMLGISTRFWFASEHMSEGTHDYYAFVNFDRVDVREMIWAPDGTFSLDQPSATHVIDMHWNRDSVETGWLDTLLVKAVNPSGAWVGFEVGKLDSVTDAETLVPPAALGLPDSLQLADTLTTYAWPAVRYRDSTGTEGHTRFILRLADHTASAQTVFVGAAGTCSGTGDDPGGGEIIDPARLQVLQGIGPQMRPLAANALTDAPALLVELPSAMPARVEIFDLQGRRLATLADRELPAGATVLPWEGGARHGIYFARLVTPHATRWSRIVRVR